MNVSVLQRDTRWEDKPANFARVRAMVEQARLPARSMLLLPEMFATGFSMNVSKICEPDGGATETFLSALASEFQIYLTGGVVKSSADGSKGLNQSVTFGPDGNVMNRYSKIHPFTFGTESKHYVGGNEICTFDVEALTVCPFVCYDLRFPEIFRDATSAGATLFTIIANWPAAREHHWLTLLQARAIENQAYVAGVNRCGTDPNVTYSGRSVIVDPRGNILADAGANEGIATATLDADTQRTYRQDFPALKDMRWSFEARGPS